MSVTVVHDYYLTPDANISEVKKAAAEFVSYLSTVPPVQLTLWLEDRENPLHHFHINVVDSAGEFEKLLKSPETKRFSDRLSPHIAHRTHLAPLCDVWLAQGQGFTKVDHS